VQFDAAFIAGRNGTQTSAVSASSPLNHTAKTRKLVTVLRTMLPQADKGRLQPACFWPGFKGRVAKSRTILVPCKGEIFILVVVRSEFVGRSEMVLFLFFFSRDLETGFCSARKVFPSVVGFQAFRVGVGIQWVCGECRRVRSTNRRSTMHEPARHFASVRHFLNPTGYESVMLKFFLFASDTPSISPHLMKSFLSGLENGLEVRFDLRFETRSGMG